MFILLNDINIRQSLFLYLGIKGTGYLSITSFNCSAEVDCSSALKGQEREELILGIVMLLS